MGRTTSCGIQAGMGRLGRDELSTLALTMKNMVVEYINAAKWGDGV